MTILENPIILGDFIVPINAPVANEADGIPEVDAHNYHISDYVPRKTLNISERLVMLHGKLGSFQLSAFRRATPAECTRPSF